MISGNSRYNDSTQIHVSGHSYDKFRRLLINGDDKTSTQPLVQNNTILYRLPNSPSNKQTYMEYIVKEDESIQLLAFKILHNHDLWWMIADFNPKVWYPLDLTPGTVINIPIQ